MTPSPFGPAHAAKLETEARALKDALSDHNWHRIRRAVSWYRRAAATEPNAHYDRFVFLWIAFNAAYGDPSRRGWNAKNGERDAYCAFVKRLVRRPSEADHVERYVVAPLEQDLLELEGIVYIAPRYWKGLLDFTHFFDRNRRFRRNLKQGRLEATLRSTVDRLYEVRNQVFHGSTTHAVGYGRRQVELGAKTLSRLVPVALQIMLTRMRENPMDSWGTVESPRAGPQPDPDRISRSAARRLNLRRRRTPRPRRAFHNHSRSLVKRTSPWALRIAICTAADSPTSTTSSLPRVTAVYKRLRRSMM